jgi:hypothetical protein
MKLCVLSLLILLSVLSVAKPAPTVLLLNSYHTQYPWTEKLTEGVIDALVGIVASENIHVEHMDSRRFADDTIYSEKFIGIQI